MEIKNNGGSKKGFNRQRVIRFPNERGCSRGTQHGKNPKGKKKKKGELMLGSQKKKKKEKPTTQGVTKEIRTLLRKRNSQNYLTWGNKAVPNP